MLNVGLIGLGPEWEHRYRPRHSGDWRALAVRCVQASIISRAEQAAAELGCDVAPGLLSLMEREDVQALLVLDTAWYGSMPAQFACRVGKPAFLASRLAHSSHGADQLVRRAAHTGVTLMPDFAHRYTPGTSRLRELIATRLGRPQGPGRRRGGGLPTGPCRFGIAGRRPRRVGRRAGLEHDAGRRRAGHGPRRSQRVAGRTA